MSERETREQAQIVNRMVNTVIVREQAAEIARLTALIQEQAHTESEYAKALEEEIARLKVRVAELEQALAEAEKGQK